MVTDLLERRSSSAASRALPARTRKEELVSTGEIGHRPGMVGNCAAVEGPSQKDEHTPLRPGRQGRVSAVRVTFEANRLAATCLATAYEQALPLRRRSATTVAYRPLEQQPAERTGA